MDSTYTSPQLHLSAALPEYAETTGDFDGMTWTGQYWVGEGF